MAGVHDSSPVAHLVAGGEWMWKDGCPLQVQLGVPHEPKVVFVLGKAAVSCHYSLDISLNNEDKKRRLM